MARTRKGNAAPPSRYDPYSSDRCGPFAANHMAATNKPNPASGAIPYRSVTRCGPETCGWRRASTAPRTMSNRSETVGGRAANTARNSSSYLDRQGAG